MLGIAEKADRPLACEACSLWPPHLRGVAGGLLHHQAALGAAALIQDLCQGKERRSGL